MNADDTAALSAIVQAQPRASLDEVTRELFRRKGKKVNPVTVRKALREAGIEGLKPQRRAGERAAVQGSPAVRVGYTDAHRRSDGASGMNTDLTDAEWALVADLFERDGRRGGPPRFDRRTVVNACRYVLRTGCAWRFLPKSFPPWQAAYMSFKRWGSSGVFEVMLVDGGEGMLTGRVAESMAARAGVDGSTASTLAAAATPFLVSFLKQKLS